MSEQLRPMATAPRDGSEIMILARERTETVLAYYCDCQWLREDCPETGVSGDPEVTDCWRIVDAEDDPDIELENAIGWHPVE